MKVFAWLLNKSFQHNMELKFLDNNILILILPQWRSIWSYPFNIMSIGSFHREPLNSLRNFSSFLSVTKNRVGFSSKMLFYVFTEVRFFFYFAYMKNYFHWYWAPEINLTLSCVLSFFVNYWIYFDKILLSVSLCTSIRYIDWLCVCVCVCAHAWSRSEGRIREEEREGKPWDIKTINN